MATRASFPKICVALGIPEADKLVSHARHEIEQGERFLEFRLDYLRTPEEGIERNQVAHRRVPGATVFWRPAAEKKIMGISTGSIEQQVRVLSAAIDAGARAVDLEIESAETRGVPLERLRRASFVVSYHNWESTPALDPVVRRLSKISADMYKLVTTAKKPSDIARVLNAVEAGASAEMGAAGDGRSRACRLACWLPPAGFAWTYAAPCCRRGHCFRAGSARTLAAPLSRGEDYAERPRSSA